MKFGVRFGLLSFLLCSRALSLAPMSVVQFGALQGSENAQAANSSSGESIPFSGVVRKLFGIKRMRKPAAYNDIFMRYMPSHDLVVCGCGKCGTSSLYEYLYNNEFNKTWKDVYGGTEPYIHDVMSKRWEGKFRMVAEEGEQRELMNKSFSFAIIRDPRERLLSAWKSKIACGCGGEQCDFYTDVGTRPMMVRKLLTLAQLDMSEAQQDGKCMDLEHFLNAVSKVHRDGNVHLLDRHFLPMAYGCFFDYGPDKWDKIVALKRPDSLVDLASKIGSPSVNAPVTHQSVGKVKLSAEAVALLDEITVPEYELLGDYLKREESYLAGAAYPLKPGVWA